MAKIQLTAETLSPDRRKPGFALLKVSGWVHGPEQTQLAIQRSEDEKYLGSNGDWEPIPVWQSLENMQSGEGGVLQGDVGPALVDPIVNAPNNSYRVTLKSGADSETRTMKIDSAVLSSSASGSAPDSSAFAGSFILGNEPEPEPAPVEITPPPADKIVPETPIDTDNGAGTTIDTPTGPVGPGFFSRHKIVLLLILLLLLLGAAVGTAWFFKWFPFSDQMTKNDAPVAERKAAEPVPDTSADTASSMVSEAGGPAESLSDLQLLQRFVATRPDTDAILAKAAEWRQTNRCEAMLRLLVHSGHKSNDARIALTYAKLYDPNLFQPGNCVDKADKDTAIYWYQKAVDAGDTEAAGLLNALK